MRHISFKLYSFSKEIGYFTEFIFVIWISRNLIPWFKPQINHDMCTCTKFLWDRTPSCFLPLKQLILFFVLIVLRGNWVAYIESKRLKTIVENNTNWTCSYNFFEVCGHTEMMNYMFVKVQVLKTTLSTSDGMVSARFICYDICFNF